ncbi:preprotein translocase subunit SecA [Bullifex porci]|uniref:preprotein translocase subunit SecA n=1 Tax=Bullifex porci TaxID=2606638 RepID=UPI0023F3A04C|nr:preprotein translocase subunit SecA [Bullifex porci]MDD7255649.1 preprotein translocase subunit SecA [Bullifex porci]MDY2741059.1 preprotein translocase subunit SecA [Bullifex porci]
MANKFLAALFGGTKQDKDIKRLRPIVEKVNALSTWAEGLTHEDILNQTQEWKEEIQSGQKKLDDILPWAFAVAREASARVLGERHYDVQIMGAIVLHEGSILELKTGEGKTLTCVPAAYLNALSGEGVHIVTVNDYLAQRDATWMGPIYEYLGLSVGVILSTQDNQRKKEAYSKDITYGTNNEFGFDYLRDNMKWRMEDKIQPKHHFCIVDEIDSILIDEARTPLIISGQAEDDSKSVRTADSIVQFLKECEKDPATGEYYELSKFEMLDKDAVAAFDEKGDYRIDEKSKNITFTKQGITHLENILKSQGLLITSKDENGEDTTSIYDDGNFEYIHYVTEAVIAHKMFEKDVDYVVKDGEVQIVDQFTGRILPGRRYNNGLHQAIEAKEGVKIQAQSKTFATITFQNFFRMYDKLSGMTGTADTEATEFKQIYDLDVVVVPTNKPVKRVDLPDLIYFDEKQKFNAIVEEVKKIHLTGQPVLIGTVSIEKSEVLSALFRRAGIKHEVLNAKNHAREAFIIGEAGAKGAVTISTNMAGRGTDIKLGGSLEHLALKKVGTEASSEELKQAMEALRPEWLKANEEVKALGGLYIIGSERHESRRIDNQLRGRSGRQGDPGTSRFFVSLDDSLMRLFASDSVKNVVGKLGLKDGEPLENKMLTNAIEKAQLRVEERNFEIRKRLLDYDNVLNEQRNYIYEQRDEILKDEDLSKRVLDNISDLVNSLYEENKKDINSFRDSLLREFTTDFSLSEEELNSSDVLNIINQRAERIIQDKENLISKEQFNIFLRSLYLRNIDKRWIDHLDALEDIKDAASLRSYAQKNPLVEYKNEAGDAYDRMLNDITENICRMAIAVKFTLRTPTRTQSAGPQITLGPKRRDSHITAQAQQNNTIIRTTAKVGRNDPCPCGSGKKYKNCCGRNI